MRTSAFVAYLLVFVAYALVFVAYTLGVGSDDSDAIRVCAQ